MNYKIESKKKRGVSEVISTLLILAITMMGAVFVSSFVQSTTMVGMNQLEKSDVFPSSIRLTAYDSRDSDNLSQIINLNNTLDQSLCTTSCQTNPSFIPIFGGTEFIVIQIRNSNAESIFLHNISVDYVNHYWDEKTSTKLFDASSNDDSGKYPSNGKFSILPMSNDVSLIQRDSFEVNGGEEVRVVIKLSEKFSSDIKMWKPVQIFLSFGGPEPVEFIILSGDVR